MRQYFPYKRLRADPKLLIHEARVDGLKPEPYPVEDHLHTVELGRVLEPAAWSTARFHVRLESSSEELSGRPDLRALVIASCQSTNLRRAVLLHEAAPGLFEGVLELPRELCRGRVDVFGVLSDTVGATPHRRIAGTSPWQVRFDAAEPLAIHGALDVRWMHFVPVEGQQDPPVPAEARGESFYVDLTGSEPVVFLNLSIGGLHALLTEAKGRPVLEEQLRDSELRRIATATWTALFNVAITGIRDGDSGADADWPSEEWQARVLRTLLPRAYPDAELVEGLETAAAELRDGDPNLQTRVQLAVSQLLGAGKALEKGLLIIDGPPNDVT